MNYSTPCDESSWLASGFVLDMDSLAGYFERMHDGRCARGKRYGLAQICILATLAKLSGEDRPFGIAQFAQLRHRGALDGFRPVYQEDDSVSGQSQTFAESMLQLTNAPALPTLLCSIAGMGLVSILTALGMTPFQRLAIASTPLSFVFNVAVELMLWATFGAVAYSFMWTLRLL